MTNRSSKKHKNNIKHTELNIWRYEISNVTVKKLRGLVSYKRIVTRIAIRSQHERLRFVWIPKYGSILKKLVMLNYITISIWIFEYKNNWMERIQRLCKSYIRNIIPTQEYKRILWNPLLSHPPTYNVCIFIITL